MSIGDRRLEAKSKKREEARRTYEAAKAEGKTTSLLEQQRPNVFQMNVANILPATKCVSSYATPNYSYQPKASTSLSIPAWSARAIQTNPLKALPPRINGSGIRIYRKAIPTRCATTSRCRSPRGLPLQDVSCRTHETKITYNNESEARVSTDLMTLPPPTGISFAATASPAARSSPACSLLRVKTKTFFLLMVQPPERPQPAQIPPRDFVSFVDVSGSMNGFPLNTPRSSLAICSPRCARKTRSISSPSLETVRCSRRRRCPRRQKTSRPPQPARSSQRRRWHRTIACPAKSIRVATGENVSRSIAIITGRLRDIEAEAFELVPQPSQPRQSFWLSASALPLINT